MIIHSLLNVLIVLKDCLDHATITSFCLHFKYIYFMKSGEIKYKITLYGHKGKVCQTHLFVIIQTMVLCGYLMTQDGADQLECVIGYATLYLVKITWNQHLIYFEKFLSKYSSRFIALNIEIVVLRIPLIQFKIDSLV